MRMRARPYLHCAPVPDGVYFSGARTRFVLRGWDRLFKVADVCVPLLERGTTEDELVAALGTERSRSVVRLLTGGLRDHGMLLEGEALLSSGPSEADRARYAGALAYLESVCADPYAAFARVRAARVALLGPDDTVQPAVRGLERAGVGEARAVDAAEPDAWRGADAVVCCGSGAEPLAEQLVVRVARDVREGVAVVPVLLDEHALQAGPAVRGDAAQPALAAVRRRVRAWARGEGLRPAARPVADAMAGALAGQLALDVLAGVGEEGAAYVVHGDELTAERIVVAPPAAETEAGVRSLPEAAREAVPDADEAIERVHTFTRRFTGLLTPSPAEQDLPQMPLAIREMDFRTGSVGRVAVWGAHQRDATVGAVLEVLRRSGRLPAERGTGAAGLTEERWLLDGALRHLVAETRTLDVELDESEETQRIRRTLRDWQAGPLTVRLAGVAGIDWRLARVEDARSGEPLGAAWAPDADTAVREALSTSLAAARIDAARDGATDLPLLRTDALQLAEAEQVDAVRAQVCRLAAARGVSFEGRPMRRDPVLGELPFWFGPVVVRQLTEEPPHA
ncbi:hypothetical protein [Streptomyces xiaopingdaonensis]|uniref:hypothetical protein n=1 Tax=Streptomyces xiaopingdaonensis TaxID=1565415 RepID=UPI001ED8F0E7|nr:hypothetical protein [Streptomyces xiaopingdaonensis]